MWCDIATHLFYFSRLNTHSSGMLSSSLWTTARRGHLPADYNDVFWFWLLFLPWGTLQVGKGTGCNMPCAFFFCLAQWFSHCLTKAVIFSDSRLFYLSFCPNTAATPLPSQTSCLISVLLWFIPCLEHRPGGAVSVGLTVPTPFP